MVTGRRFFSQLGKRFGGQHGPAGPFETNSSVLDRYVSGFPNLQNAIDAVPGWVGAMPPETGLNAGKAALYADTRIAWLLNECFPVTGKSVLELGPLEAFHTYMLHQAGAAEIDAIDANALAFFRCLITKEALNLDRARFFLGDFMKWLEETDKRYDLVVASGVLYHSHDPIRLLELICERAESFYLWTHYFDDVAMPPGDLRRVPFSERVESKQCRGVTIRLHERSYYKAWRNPAFCGGIQDRHFWIDREDILAVIKTFGFDQIKIADEQPGHKNGPSFSVFAQRTPAAAIQVAAPSCFEPSEPEIDAAVHNGAVQEAAVQEAATPASQPVVPMPEEPAAEAAGVYREPVAEPPSLAEVVEAPEPTAEPVSKPPDSRGEMQPAPPDNAGAATDPEPASLPPQDGQV